jgi:autotransporter-associated beta strand protein
LLKDGLSLNVGTLSGDAGALAWLYPNSVLTINQTSNATFAGTIKDNTFGSVVKTGTGTLTLSGSNTYQGATTINAGAVSLAANNAIANSVAVALANTAGVSLNINGTTQTIGTLVGGGASGGNINLGSGGAALTVLQKTFSDYTGVIGGTGSFTKSGPGVLRLNGASTYTGNTILAAGEIIIGATNALPTSSALSFTGASRLLLINQNVSQQFSSLTSTFGVSGVSIFGYKTGGFNLNQSGSTTFYGDLVGAFEFAKSGSGTITLSGARGARETITAGAIN